MTWPDCIAPCNTAAAGGEEPTVCLAVTVRSIAEITSAERMRGATDWCGRRGSSGDGTLGESEGGGSVGMGCAADGGSGGWISRAGPASNIRTTTSTPVSTRGGTDSDTGRERTDRTMTPASARWIATEYRKARWNRGRSDRDRAGIGGEISSTDRKEKCNCRERVGVPRPSRLPRAARLATFTSAADIHPAG